MPTFKLTLAYDGTNYVGWQRQAAGTSIQGLIEDALRELDGRDVMVNGAGRTDAGVHALGQVASCTLERTLEDVQERLYQRDLVSLEVASEMLNNGRASGVHSAAWIGEVL